MQASAIIVPMQPGHVRWRFAGDAVKADAESAPWLMALALEFAGVNPFGRMAGAIWDGNAQPPPPLPILPPAPIRVGCDGCGLIGAEAENGDVARYMVRQRGWTTRAWDGQPVLDLCPQCQPRARRIAERIMERAREEFGA